MLVSHGETFELELIKRVGNSPYEYEVSPSIHFKGRPANNLEKKIYRVTAGVNASEDGIFVYTSYLPEDVKPMDQVTFMGKKWTVASVGYYLLDGAVANASIFSTKHLEERCPKGLSLQ